MLSAHLRDYVYLDYAATAPLCEEAARAMRPYGMAGSDALAFGGNANSLHTPGRLAFEALEQARSSLARNLGARRPSEIMFTSGATEANNAALCGISAAVVAARKQQGQRDFVPHVVVSALEHDAVLKPAKYLERQGFRVTRLMPDAFGFISAETLQKALGDDTVLVSIQAANSEVGTIQPLLSLVEATHAVGAFFHTDAVQALGKISLDMGKLQVDAASFSAHKIGGPKGVGALYLKERTPFVAQIRGGGQEEGRRSGTQNVCGAVGFAAACNVAVASQPKEAKRLRDLRDYLYAELGKIAGVKTTVCVQKGSEDFLPHIVHVLADGLESETLVLRFDEQGFAVSGGSACSTHSLEPSHVLRALGISRDRAYGALRVSLGRYTTTCEVKRFLSALTRCLNWD